MKKFIKQRLREDLEYHHVSDATQDEYVLNEDMFNDNLKNEYIKLGLKGEFDSSEEAMNHLENVVGMLKGLPQNVTLYRVIFVNSESEIDYKYVGSHYILDKKNLESKHSDKSHVGGGSPIMLTVKSPKNIIDVDATIRHRMEFPHEDEITLKNKGLGAKIIKTEQFKTRDSEEDLLGNPQDFGDFGDFGGFDDY